MTDVHYILASLAAMIASALLFRKAAGSLSPSRLNMISYIFYYHFLLQGLIGATFVVVNADHHYLISRWATNDVRIYGWLAVVYAALATPAAMIVTAKLWGARDMRRLFRRYCERPIRAQDARNDFGLRLPLYILTVLSLAAVVYTFASLSDIPVMELLSGEGAERLAMLRQAADRDFGGNTYVKNLFGLLLTPLVSYVAFAYWQTTRRTGDFLWFATMFCASLIMMTYNLAKAPILWFILAFVFEFVLLRGKIDRKVLLAIGATLVALVFGLYLTVAGATFEGLVSGYSTGILGRLLFGQIAGIFVTLQLFPEKVPFIGLSSVSGLLSDWVGAEQALRSSRVIMQHFNPSGIHAGTAGAADAVFVAEAWANFGLMGVLIAPLYVGFVIQTTNVFLLGSRKTPLVVGFFTQLSTFWPITGGFNDFIYNPALFVLLLILAACYATDRALRVITAPRRVAA